MGWISNLEDQAEFLHAVLTPAAATAKEGGRAARANRLKMAEGVLSFYPAVQCAWIGPENNLLKSTQLTAKCGTEAWRVYQQRGMFAGRAALPLSHCVCPKCQRYKTQQKIGFSSFLSSLLLGEDVLSPENQ